MKKYLLFFLSCANLMIGAPYGHVVTEGEAYFSQDDVMLHVQTRANTRINWREFCIAQQEEVHFAQPSSDHMVVNSVLGGNPSEIFGVLSSNGKVVLISPKGIHIGPDARIDVASFLGATSDILERDFFSEEKYTFTDLQEGKITNLGTIKTDKGDITLIARQIENHGTLSATSGEVILAAAPQVIIRPKGQHKVYIKTDENIETVKESINTKGIYANAIRGRAKISGEIHSNGNPITILAEEVELLGGEINSGGTTGGEIKIGNLQNQRIHIDENSRLVSSGAEGESGHISIISNGKVTCFGGIQKKSLHNPEIGGCLTIQGLDGYEWRNQETGRTHSSLLGVIFNPVGAVIIDNSCTGGPNTFGNMFIEDYLNGTATCGPLQTQQDVEISNDANSFTINASNGITWSTAQKLTFRTERNIVATNCPLANTSATNSDAILIEANIQVTPTTGGFAGVESSGTDVMLISTNTGSITIMGKGGTTNAATVGHGVYFAPTTTNDVSITSTDGDITIEGITQTPGNPIPAGSALEITRSQITTTGTGNISLEGTMPNVFAANNGASAGVYFADESSVTTSGSGNIEIEGTSGTTGQSTNSSGVQFGMQSNPNTVESTGSGMIMITGTGRANNSTESDGIHLTHTNLRTNSGTITLMGTAESTTTNDANGVNIVGDNMTATDFESTTGNISITGVAMGSGNNVSGIVCSKRVEASAGAITLDGTGSSNGNQDAHGIDLDFGDTSTAIEGNSVTMIGRGGGAVAETNDGIRVSNGVNVTSLSPSGVMDLEGFGSVNGEGAGIRVQNMGTTMQTNPAPLRMVGHAAAVGDQIGIFFDDQSTLTSGSASPSLVQTLSDLIVMGSSMTFTGTGTVTFNLTGDVKVIGIPMEAKIATTQPLLDFTIGNDLVVLGGSGMDDFAIIGEGAIGSTAALKFNVGRDVLLTGGSADGAYAEVGMTGPGIGNLTFTSVGRDITLTGGLQSYAQIGNVGGNSAENIVINNVGGIITLIGGNTTYAQIGHVGDGSTGIIDIGTISGDVNLTGGIDSYKQIGNVGDNSSSNITISSIGGTLNLMGGTSSHAQIGNVGTGATGDILLSFIGGDVNIQGGSSSYAQIGGRTGTFPGNITISQVGGNVTLTGGGNAYAQIGDVEGNSSGDITLTNVGGNLNLTAAPNAGHTTIGHGNPLLTAGNKNGDITIQLNGSGTLQGSVNGGADATASIGHWGDGAGGNININANNSWFLNGGSDAIVGNNTIPGNILMFAGLNITLTANSGQAIVAAPAGNVTLVVDNQFPTPPGFDGGQLILGSGTSITADTSQFELRLYTVQPSQNTFVDGTINGAPFTPGPFLVDNDQETYATYFPNGGYLDEQNFHIYYKVGEPGPPIPIIPPNVIPVLRSSFHIARTFPLFGNLGIAPFKGSISILDACGNCCPGPSSPYGSFIFEDTLIWAH